MKRSRIKYYGQFWHLDVPISWAGNAQWFIALFTNKINKKQLFFVFLSHVGFNYGTVC